MLKQYGKFIQTKISSMICYFITYLLSKYVILIACVNIIRYVYHLKLRLPNPVSLFLFQPFQ